MKILSPWQRAVRSSPGSSRCRACSLAAGCDLVESLVAGYLLNVLVSSDHRERDQTGFPRNRTPSVRSSVLDKDVTSIKLYKRTVSKLKPNLTFEDHRVIDSGGCVHTGIRWVHGLS
jgi:hypothetical protein